LAEIETSTDDDVLTIRLNRPRVRNALSGDMQSRLVAALATADQDPRVRAVILTGADPAFCAGNDFTDLDQFADRYSNRFRADPGRALRAMKTPVICAVNGACVSGGLEIALSASFIVASDRARFADTHARLNVIPTWGLTALLPRAVGVRLARELSITGRFLEAPEALRRGLVNHVVPHDELLAFTKRLAGSVVETAAVPDVLRLYARGEDLSFSAALSDESATAFGRPLDPADFASRGHRVTKDPT
jgi:enoyl-CoA hydratase